MLAQAITDNAEQKWPGCSIKQKKSNTIFGAKFASSNGKKINSNMAHTFSQLHAQVVFSAKNREALIEPEWKDKLYKYIWGICNKKGVTLLAIGGIHDHIHILFQYNPNLTISTFVQILKQSTQNWINNNFYKTHVFEWQEGFGAFSYGLSAIENVKKYINSQEEHHKTESFLNEYKKMISLPNEPICQDKPFDGFEKQ